MVLILSRAAEYSTNRVTEWIEALGGRWVRLNDSFLRSTAVPYSFLLDNDDEGLELYASGQSFDIREINVVWYRKWASGDDLSDLHDLTDNKEWATNLFNHVSRELTGTSQLLFDLLQRKKWLDDPETVKGIRKNRVLTVARRLGLRVPNTLITNRKDRVVDFIEANERIICKPISEVTFFNNDQYEFLSYTQEITREALDSMQEWFYPSQFQQLIEKKFEIRTFYLDGRCYSMAIFSQAGQQSKIDFRDFNAQKPHRMVPYQLPEHIEASIRLLMDELNLATGSLDFIVTPDDHFYFLEVNPVGQFGMTSYPCNYRLEKKIAQYLIHHDQ